MMEQNSLQSEQEVSVSFSKRSTSGGPSASGVYEFIYIHINGELTLDGMNGEIVSSISETLLLVNRPDVFRNKRTYSMVKRDVLLCLPLISEYYCDKVARHVLSTMESIMGESVPLKGCKDLDVYVTVILTLLSPIGFIPATDSSINSLEIKKIGSATCDESCSICFEEFLVDDYAACMPCKHVFHGICIKGWLKTSHYCPVCRFEMPTS